MVGLRSALTLVVLVLYCDAVVAAGKDLEKAALKGFGVLEVTTVEGEFKGCEFNKRIGLSNGLVFVCGAYNYDYGFMPEVLIMRHVKSGALKVLIDRTEYAGELYRRQ